MPRYVIKASRYINGELIYASPDFPAEIEVPEGQKIDAGLFPVDSAQAREVLKPHFAPKDTKHAMSKDVHSTPIEQQKGKRPSDSKPV